MEGKSAKQSQLPYLVFPCFPSLNLFFLFPSSYLIQMAKWHTGRRVTSALEVSFFLNFITCKMGIRGICHSFKVPFE